MECKLQQNYGQCQIFGRASDYSLSHLEGYEYLEVCEDLNLGDYSQVFFFSWLPTHQVRHHSTHNFATFNTGNRWKGTASCGIRLG